MGEDRTKKIIKKLNLEDLPFKLKYENQIKNLSKEIVEQLSKDVKFLNKSDATKWCFSSMKKIKVFMIIYAANENSEEIYKEEIAKKLSEYSYKTIANIIDDGLKKGFFVSLDPFNANIKDRKIKNIRPSEELIVSFTNWNIYRISKIFNLIKKYK